MSLGLQRHAYYSSLQVHRKIYTRYPGKVHFVDYIALLVYSSRMNSKVFLHFHVELIEAETDFICIQKITPYGTWLIRNGFHLLPNAQLYYIRRKHMAFSLLENELIHIRIWDVRMLSFTFGLIRDSWSKVLSTWECFLIYNKCFTKDTDLHLIYV